MADDSRIDGAVSRLMLTHPSWFKRLTTVRNRNRGDPGHADALYAARTIAEAAVRGADAEDPLRALLADERRATRLIATTWVGAFGAAWEDCSPEARDMTLIRAGHVLAALQKVADRA